MPARTPSRRTTSASTSRAPRRRPSRSPSQRPDPPECDVIQYRKDYGVLDQNSVGFVLRGGPGITWWKGFQVFKHTGELFLEEQDGNTATGTLALVDIDMARPPHLWKAKVLGV